MIRYDLKDVFTPTSSAKVTFVERVNQNVDTRLSRALRLPGNQVVIYGHSGSGKSTLLDNVLFRTYEKHISTNCMRGMTFEQVVLDAFDQLKEFYVQEVTSSNRVKVDATAKADYMAIKAQIGAVYENSEGQKQVRLLPPQLTPQNLGRLLGQSGYCWVLEDFHKIEGEEKEKLAQMMKVFVDLSAKYQDLKIIALGAVNTARQVVKSDKEMRKRVSEIHVDLMTDREIEEIIRKGCVALNIKIADDVQEDIIKYSNGLASICHKICYFLCDSALITETVTSPVEFISEDLQNALSEYIKDEEDTLKDAFDSALKIKAVDLTLRALIAQDPEGAHIDDIFSYTKDNGIRVTKKKLQEDLQNLEKEEFGEMVKLEDNSQKYSFIDPFYRSFAMAYFEERENRPKKSKVTDKEMIELFNAVMKNVRANYNIE
ncbi:hypothetical protein [Cobetia sp. 29-18-1]|uniref:hypothetical protein n=1 Tax=Cobetia sp. 29-18-1 TaxID=3040018 RepID=UPI00244BCA48|nr:hypothetical protein [Cobetia sp. 29-18-1]MDH2297436.1 hypothetical protein [Cobetia sp. 29-18-1]